MLNRTPRSVAFVLAWVTAVLAVGASGQSRAVSPEATATSIGFDQIESLMLAGSPRLRIIEQRTAAVAAERDMSLEWSNPALAYDHEQSDESTEWQVTLAKRFDRPFGQTALRSSWDDRLLAADLEKDQAVADLLGEMKAGYVELRLQEDHLNRLERLSELMDLATGIAEERHAEGELSGAEKQLVVLAKFSVDAARRAVRVRQRRATGVWRTDMGLTETGRPNLATRIGFRDFPTGPAEHYAELLSRRPGHRSRESLSRALESAAQAARPSLVPGFDLYGGYKRFEDEDDGFVAGVALDLPFFDRKGGESQLLDIQRAVLRHETDAALARRKAEVATLLETVAETREALAEFEIELGGRDPLADTLLFSFREGALTLNALLGAIQIETASLEDYYASLTAYYENLFRLEAITGAVIVDFAAVQE